MNKELIDWVDEVYENYTESVYSDGIRYMDDVKEYDEIYDSESGDEWPIVVPYTKDDFIERIKSDNKFAERWGVSVNRRELTFEERCEIQIDKLDGMYSSEKNIFIHHSIDEVKRITMDKNKIPKKVISLTYNNKTIEIYE
jgi:hypothetical protein